MARKKIVRSQRARYDCFVSLFVLIHACDGLLEISWRDDLVNQGDDPEAAVSAGRPGGGGRGARAHPGSGSNGDRDLRVAEAANSTTTVTLGPSGQGIP